MTARPVSIAAFAGLLLVSVAAGVAPHHAIAQDDQNCIDFPGPGAAQAHLDADLSDPDNLDGNNDGEACEDTDWPSSGDGGGGQGTGTAQGTTQVQREQTSATGAPIRIALDCYSTPEVVRITNNRNRAIFLATLGSLYRPRDNEPFAVNRRLNVGATVMFRFGTGAGADALTRQFIFQNDVAARDEGVVVATSVGAFLYHASPEHA